MDTKHLHLYGKQLLTVFLVIMVSQCSDRGDPVTGHLRSAHIERAALALRGSIGLGERIGSITDAAVDSLGNILVLDASHKQVLWYSPEGHQVSRVGHEGRGPWELAGPVAIVMSGPEEVAILDPPNGRMLTFRMSGDSLIPRAQVLVSPTVTDLCEMNGKIFGLGLIDGHIIHEIGSNGEINFSFGTALGETPLERELSVTGFIICHEGANAIVIASRISPTVRAFYLDGTEAWHVVLDDFAKTQYVQTEGGFAARAPKSGRLSMLEGLSSLDDRTVVVQIVTRGPKREREEPLDSRILNMEDGSTLRRVEGWPRMITGRKGTVYAVGETLEPQIQVFDLVPDKPNE